MMAKNIELTALGKVEDDIAQEIKKKDADIDAQMKVDILIL